MCLAALALVCLAAHAPRAAADGLGLPLERTSKISDAAVEALGVAPSAKGIAAFLREIDRDLKAGGAEQMLDELGDPSYQKRQQATNRIAASDAVSDAVLERASENHPDPEVRIRAAQALQRRGAEGRTNPLEMVLRYAAEHELAGVAPWVIRVTGAIGTDALWPDAFLAVGASARAEELEAYRGLAETEDAKVRALARLAEWVAAGEEGAASAGEALDRGVEPHVRLAAAWALTAAGEARGVIELTDLLEQRDFGIRLVAIQALRSSTDQRFGFAATGDPRDQTEQARDWRQWAKANASTVKLKPPRHGAAGETEQRGLTLLAFFQRNKVVEFDARGRETWSVSVDNPYGVHGLPNGHRLVGSFSQKAVYEYDASGSLVWQKQGLPGGAMSVQRLDNGNTLVACSDADVVREYSRAGNLVWEAEIGGRPVQAERLENGRTLVALQNANKVVELNAAGETVWTLSGVKNPQSAVRLPSGHTLVTLTDEGKVVVFDREGDPGRAIPNLEVPLDVDGSTGDRVYVVEQRRGLTMVMPDGERRLLIDLREKNPILARFDRY